MNATATLAPAGPQHLRALERANEVRLARAELKRNVAMEEIDAAEVILDCPWEVESMAVAELLTSQRRWGRIRCRKLLAQIPMSERKTVGSMTERQRGAVAAMLNSADRPLKRRDDARRDDARSERPSGVGRFAHGRAEAVARSGTSRLPPRAGFDSRTLAPVVGQIGLDAPNQGGRR
jgi:hypothetical protein